MFNFFDKFNNKISGQNDKSLNKEFKLLHLGINQHNKYDAKDLTVLASELFGMTIEESNSEYLLDGIFEITKVRGLGKHGHIALGTNDLDKSLRNLSSKGIETIKDSEVLDERGKLKEVYLDTEFGGFAIHLTQI
ncbi:hypothetical protein ACWY2R_03635 [Enterococcus avium]